MIQIISYRGITTLLGQYCNITITTQYQGTQICHYNGMDIIVTIITITQVCTIIADANIHIVILSYHTHTRTHARTHTHTGG